MKKLIQLLALSAGSGMLVGAGVRWAERRRATSEDHPRDTPPDPRIARFAERIEAIERRLDAQSAAEERRGRELSRQTEERIETLGQAIQERIEQRMDPLEAELAMQRSSVAELREYSLRTERSLQKLLAGVDKLVSAQSPGTDSGFGGEREERSHRPGHSLRFTQAL